MRHQQRLSPVQVQPPCATRPGAASHQWESCGGGLGLSVLDESPIGKSREQRLNLSGSKQQGLSTAYNTVFRPSRLQGIYPNERVELS